MISLFYGCVYDSNCKIQQLEATKINITIIQKTQPEEVNVQQ